jgi:hypothetical protein
LIKFENGDCVIRSFDDYYLCSELNAEGKITSTRESIGPWETFHVTELSGNCIALKASNGKYISINQQSQQLSANADSIGRNETFIMTEE